MLENELIEEPSEDEGTEEVPEDEYSSEEIEPEDIGKYASSSSGEEEIEDSQGNIMPKKLFIPRCRMHAYKQAEGYVLK